MTNHNIEASEIFIKKTMVLIYKVW